jgi:hypothetical protein
MKICCWLIILFFMAVCSVPSHAIMDFQYKCTGSGATVSTYSYLKEPRIEETGYTRGLKSGSFNYLENGSINLEENIKYYYGNGTNITNSSVEHDLKVDFSGDRGISEFFGKGFFGNNRWISAWKKIRYEESPSMKIDGKVMESHPSNDISVEASVVMDTFKRMNYQFNYHADIENGVMEAKDSTGWTNRTGARRYDWVYESLTSGKTLNITNNLYDSERIVPAAGPDEDWLPCCFSGTVPTIEQLDANWPADVVVRTLQANKILPSTQLVPGSLISSQFEPTQLEARKLAYTRVSVADKEARIGKISSTMGTQSASLRLINAQTTTAQAATATTGKTYTYPVTRNLKVGIIASVPETQLVPQTIRSSNINNSNGSIQAVLEPLTCKDGSCSGYDCIYTYNEGVSTTSSRAISAAGMVPELSVKNVKVLADYIEVNSDAKARFGDSNSISVPLTTAKQEIYKITLSNSGTVALSDVTVSAELAAGIKYESSRYYELGRGRLEVVVDPVLFNENVRTALTWNIHGLEPGEIKSILLEAFVKPETDAKMVNVEVKGKATDGTVVRDAVNTAELFTCPLHDNNGEVCPYEDDECKRDCPDWATIV